MSMLEKMARRLAQDALERVKPGTYTSVVDGVGLYQMLDGNYQVGERLGAGDEDAPGISYETVRETMVAMMAAQAGALVVVPEEAPGDPYLAQIAQLLVDSADVPTDASDVADGAAIVGTVKAALAYLDAARDENRIKYERIKVLETQVANAGKTIESLKAEAARTEELIFKLNMQIEGRLGELRAAQQEIGALTAKLEAAQRKTDRYAVELGESLTRYEGMTEAFRMALDKLAGVGK